VDHAAEDESDNKGEGREHRGARDRSNPLSAPALKTAPSQSDLVELERSIESAASVDLREAASAAGSCPRTSL